MRILVTGARGILGRHVVRYLSKIAPDVSVISSVADLTDFEAIRDEIESATPLDMVIHLAALVPVTAVCADPARAYAVNVGGTINLLRALGRTNASFVFSSSSHVYAPSDKPIQEHWEKRPVSLYGRTKWQAESIAADICDAQSRPFLAARIFSIHDPAQTGSFLRPSVEQRLANEDLTLPFELPGGDSMRDFLAAEQAAELLVRLAFASATGAVNVGSGRGTLVRDFVQSLTPASLDIRSTGSSDTLVADISRLKLLLGDIDG